MAYQYSLDPALYQQAATDTDKNLMELMAGQAQTPCPTDKNKPRVSLVVGPSPFSMMRGWEFFICSPFEGISYISSVLHNAGYPVRIIDVRYHPEPLKAAFDQTVNSSDIVGIATFEDNFPFVEELVRALKHAKPSLPVMLGGSLVTSVPETYMNQVPADVAVISEGELTILELMEAFTEGLWPRRFPEIHGICYRDESGRAVRTPPRGQMLTLDYLPPMNLSLWPQSRDPRGLQPQIISSHSRGCKMDCSFCYRTTPQLREKSVEKFRAELKYLKDNYNIKFAFFVDLTFTSNKKRTLELCEVIKEFDIGWTCLTRCADVDEEVLAAMKASGCDIILYGVESLSPDVLRAARKGSSEHIVLRAMQKTQAAGLRFGGLTIVGLPNETEESLDHMCRWAEETRSITRVKYLSAMPGTTVYQQGLKSGIVRSELEHLRWLSTEQALVHDEYLNFNNLPDQVMRRAYQRLYDSYSPGPVMDFVHFPKDLSYFYPDPERPWRSRFSSVSAPPVPGVERFYFKNGHRGPDRRGTVKIDHAQAAGAMYGM